MGLLVQEKKQKIDFQEGLCGSHFGILIRTIIASFDLQVNLMLSTKFQVHWPFSSEEETKNHCVGSNLGFPIFASFDLQVTLTLPTKFQVNWPFG